MLDPRFSGRYKFLQKYSLVLKHKAWDGDTLVAVEVKTRTAHDLAPAHVAVDRHKRRMLRRMLLAYQRQLPGAWQEVVPLRFDVLSVYDLSGALEFDLFPNAFGLQESLGEGWVRT